jgi:hypothetical protein
MTVADQPSLLLTEAAFARVGTHRAMAGVVPILLRPDGTHATVDGEAVEGPVDADFV